MILRPSYLHNGIAYTGKTTSLYWIRALKRNDLEDIKKNISRPEENGYHFASKIFHSIFFNQIKHILLQTLPKFVPKG